MKKTIRYYVLLLGLLSGYGQGIRAQGLRTSAGRGGVFVYCGKELPRGFSYVIERSGGGDTSWTMLAELRAPKNLAAFRGDVLSGPATLASYNNAGEGEINFCWSKLSVCSSLDSLYGYALNPVLAIAAGCGWWDEAPRPGTYLYRVSRKGSNPVGLAPVRLSYPAEARSFLPIRRDSLVKGDNSLQLSYGITDMQVMAGVAVYRSPLMRNEYSRVPVQVIFHKRAGREMMEITDRTASGRLAYNYRVVPYDAYGNESVLADTFPVYNASRPKEIALFTKASAASGEGGRSIGLSWKTDDHSFLISIDIYRSETYDSGYRRIASLEPAATGYTDDRVEPVKTYYYRLVGNGYYGQSWPSARMAVVQKAFRENDIPPQRVSISRKGNLVTVSWERSGTDIRGYYVYRGDGYSGEMHGLSRLILSDRALVSYTDSLPFSAAPVIYSYAVASENSSYALSPQSRRVTVTTAGNALPVPRDVATRYRDGHIELMWNNVFMQSPAVTACRIYRRVTDENDRVVEMGRMLAETKVNSYIDGDVSEGRHYVYTIEAIGQEPGDSSLPGNPVSLSIPTSLPAAPGHVMAVNTQGGVTLHWDSPLDSAIVKTRVYRSPVNGEPVLLGELSAATQEYVDGKANGGSTYFYLLSSVDARGREGRLTQAVGIHVNTGGVQK